MYENIRLLCNSLNQSGAVALAREYGVSIAGCEPNLEVPKEKHLKIKAYALTAGFEFASWRSGDPGTGAKGANFKVLKPAPALSRLVGYLDRSFTLTVQDNQLLVRYGYGGKLPGVVTGVKYFICGKLWQVDVHSPWPVLKQVAGWSTGAADRKNFTVSYLLDWGLTPDLLAHELIHLKWPPGLPETEEDVQAIAERVATNYKQICTAFGLAMGERKYKKLMKDMDQEHQRVSRDFQRLDRKIGEILGVQ